MSHATPSRTPINGGQREPMSPLADEAFRLGVRLMARAQDREPIVPDEAPPCCLVCGDDDATALRTDPNRAPGDDRICFACWQAGCGAIGRDA